MNRKQFLKNVLVATACLPFLPFVAQPAVPLKKLIRYGEQVQMKELRNGDIFFYDDEQLKKFNWFKAKSNPYINENGIWSIYCEPTGPDIHYKNETTSTTN